MGNRLSRIVTRTGDDGQTGLGSGARIAKDSAIIEALGTVDELNSWIGVLLSHAPSDAVRESLLSVQHDLFDLGAQLSVPGTRLLSPGHVERVDVMFGELNADLPPLREFILPGGSDASAFAHIARTVCRRAERRLLTALRGGREGDEFRVDEAGSNGLKYLNRLSDLLFTVSRFENKVRGQTEQFWEKGRSLRERERAGEGT